MFLHHGDLHAFLQHSGSLSGGSETLSLGLGAAVASPVSLIPSDSGADMRSPVDSVNTATTAAASPAAAPVPAMASASEKKPQPLHLGPDSNSRSPVPGASPELCGSAVTYEVSCLLLLN
jgi:hypothetical protein